VRGRAKKEGDRRIEEARMRAARKKDLYSVRSGCMSAIDGRRGRVGQLADTT
jgi:hypothetical protein